MFEIDERAGWLEPLTQLLARDEIARAVQQQGEDLDGLSREAEAHPRLAQLSCMEIQLEDAEADHTRCMPRNISHAGEPCAGRGAGTGGDPAGRTWAVIPDPRVTCSAKPLERRDLTCDVCSRNVGL